ncbi:putrescine-ornithine antiporter [Pasteurella skyensis]|uniref:Putrescine transporter PotE n=1 Tax=Phocoenobacter skyensis TaxID=97481 RepID=A0AAJ6NAU8_9PAST|nr:putrescine-ornithine antiporter [Pasteurella skyensis]MDP8163158.1 putrescine-ornithine antiporter [Pasteurella skyensis]MDP8173367.1 putrescine-ornithine antiporter [Pasteurella skyensis]MDP8177780.1 putrescine-ornithine antiporter [Pasteurella skyensis]MDP8179541.1 putrescine-ornithine antiporter [Pasteurella skyensis]MDP8182487.1 putrescine-ornithine antiporter [Pasteurella skyensis]
MAESGKSNKMGVVELTIITVVNMLGAGIIMLPTKLAKVGTMSILSWVVTAGGSLALAYAFAVCGRFSKKGGGMGGYAEYAFGRSGNFLANFTYAVSLVIANVAIALSAVGYFAVLLGIDLNATLSAALTIGLIWITTVANFGGAKITGRIGSFTVWGVIIPVLSVSVIGWFFFSPTMYAEAWNPHNMPFGEAISASIPMTLWAFLGLESACANSDAVENPEKNVPIAVLGGTTLTAIIYIVSTNVMAGIVPNLELAESTAPFGLVFAKMFSPAIGQAVMAAMVVACVGCLLGWQFTVAQVFKSGADEGYFSKVFAKVTAKDAPITGMLILAVVQTVLAFMTMGDKLAEQFSAIVDLAAVTNLVPFVLSMAAVAAMQRAENAPKSQMAMNTFVALIGNIYSFYALYSCGMVAMYWGGMATFLGWVIYGKIKADEMDAGIAKASDEA